MKKITFDVDNYTTGALAGNIIGTVLLYCILILGIKYLFYFISEAVIYASQIYVHPVILILLTPMLIIFSIGFFSLLFFLLTPFFVILFLSSKLTIVTIIQLFKDIPGDLKFIFFKFFR